MRSLVTMTSIILAIAFFTYVGMFNLLTTNLASAVEQLENFTPVPQAEIRSAAASLSQLKLMEQISPQRRRELAVTAGMADIADEQGDLKDVKDQLRVTRRDQKQAAEALTKLEASNDASPSQLTAARDTAKRQAERLQDLSLRQEALEKKIKLGQWLKDGGDDAQMQNELTRVLKQHKDALFQKASTPSRLEESDLVELDQMLALAKEHGGDVEALSTFRQMLKLEQRQHNAMELRQSLVSAGISVKDTLAGDSGNTWLIVMALLTCAVGIANAMLMSVTERFREIGTMKCLGAPDGLVVKLFLLESSFLGMIGAALGIVVGVIVSLFAGLLQFGSFGITYFPTVGALQVVAGSIVAGMVLAVVGAVYPAAVAARMNPVDALRVEE